MTEFMEVYIAEAKELLDEMNDSLLKLDKNMGDIDLINSIFRAAHTIKGNSASMGFKRMENLTHSMEDVLQDIREGKVEADGKIMELLFVCHDFLESGLYTIMQTGNEEEMKIDEILNKLHSIIGEKHEKLQSEAVCPPEKSLDCTDLTLNNEELYNLKKSVDEGFNTYLLKITLNSDCIFKSVRIWMWFQQMDSYLKVIKSEPNRPTSEDFKDNSFVFDGNVVRLLVATKYDTRQLLENLNKLLDVESIYFEPIKFEDTEFMKNQLKLVMTKATLSVPGVEEMKEDADIDADVQEKKERLIEIESEFTNDFIDEISIQIRKAETELVLLENETENNNTFYNLSRFFHTIKGLADFIGNSIIAKISFAAEVLVEHYRKSNTKINKEQIVLFTVSADFIKKLCEAKGLCDDGIFIDTVDEHVQKLKNEIYDEIQVEQQKAADIALDTETDKAIPVKEDTSSDEKGESGDSFEDNVSVEPLHAQLGQQQNKNIGKLLDSSFMRISTQKVDSLVDMLGELLILHSLMEQEASARFNANDRYMNNLLRMSKVIKGVQSLSMSLRMVSLKQAFQQAMRVGRDTAAELGKKADILVTGEETEIDRNIVDKLVDPLMHLVRNSVSHGLEDEKERVKRGKSEEGHINIRAYSKRGYVYIEVEDDGDGLSIDNIRTKAIEKNLIDPDLSYSSDEIMKLIFLPGFSTRETIDNISGRGVGMNVVETEIKKVGGKIDIQNKPGEGCKFILKIPLNMTVMNGTIVDIHGGRYIIPTLYIKQFVKPDDTQWVKVKNRKTMIQVRDDIFQIIPIAKMFGTEGSLDGEDENMVVILEVEQKFKALPVRSVIGRQEIVAKPMGKEYGELDFTTGASILGDGKVSLILDVEAIFNIMNSSNYKFLKGVRSCENTNC